MNDGKVKVQTASEMVRVEPNAVDQLARIEEHAGAIERLCELGLQRTASGDWDDFEGKPRLRATGCEKLARVAMIKIHSIRQEEIKEVDDVGSYYIIKTYLTAELPGGFDSVEVVGTASSRDKFLGTGTRAGAKLSEVDKQNIYKKSCTNAEGAAVTRLLGLRNKTWEELKRFGIDQAKAGSSVVFGKGEDTSTGAAAPAKATKKQIADIRSGVNKAGLKPDDAVAYMEKHFGVSGTADLTKANAKDMLRSLASGDLETWCNERGGDDNG